MDYTLPQPPPTNVVADKCAIVWRANASGTWDPDPCPTCESHLPGGLVWAELLRQRGPLSDVIAEPAPEPAELDSGTPKPGR